MALLHRTAVPLMSREGLERLYQEHVNRPDVLTARQYLRMTEKQRQTYDERRIRYIHHGLTIGTQSFNEAKKRLTSLYIHNAATLHDPLSLALSGAPYLGKSHTLTELARFTANRLRRDTPDFIDKEMMPCVIITVPAPTTSKGILQELLTFIGIESTRAYTEQQLRTTAVRAMNEHGTRLLAFDEAHNMTRGGPAQREATKNMIKKLMGDVEATLVFAGIDLNDNGLFEGISGRQLSSRTQLIELHPYSAATEGDREVWKTTGDYFEDALGLIGNEPGTVRSLASYLFNRTGGVMGELANTLRTAAVILIKSDAVARYGREQITQHLLDEIPMGDAAEQRRLYGNDQYDWPTFPVESLAG
ncbi:Bacterial TniB protein [Microbacterium oxydans]|uniref:Bacterial TniB protein n=2 Tax=Microbacterium oxydans TaxID=82380 RepID=A0A0F0L6R4_9MICO|nr:Bacterial TniB protein [Microbacterium oxydans]